MHDSKGRKETCTECKKDFTWVDHGNVYPGGKDREYITCPYCGANNGSIMTSGSVFSSKIEEQPYELVMFF